MSSRNGVLIRLTPSKEKSLARRVCDTIKTSSSLGYKIMIIELSEKDLSFDLCVNIPEKERFIHFLDDLDIRIAFYIRSKNHVISTDLNSSALAKDEIIKLGDFIDSFEVNEFDIPLICHIGGAKGNRRKSMEEFCEFFDSLSGSTKNKLAIINDNKPSLYSVKDLLSVTYVERKIPIIFRTNSHRTNEGGLTYKESIFLASSTWAERSNPIMVYSPILSNEIITNEYLNPYNLIVDVVIDNHIELP